MQDGRSCAGRLVLHLAHFGVFRYLEDSPAYNPSGYTPAHPAYNEKLAWLDHWR